MVLNEWTQISRAAGRRLVVIETGLQAQLSFPKNMLHDMKADAAVDHESVLESRNRTVALLTVFDPL